MAWWELGVHGVTQLPAGADPYDPCPTDILPLSPQTSRGGFPNQKNELGFKFWLCHFEAV